MRSLLFDFGGTLDGPLHWLDRFVKHYRACGLEIARAELDPAFDAATRTAYLQSTDLQNWNLATLVTHLVGLQLDFLAKNERKWKLTTSIEPAEELARRISNSFVHQSLRDLSRSRDLLVELAHHFTVGVVSNFYGNLKVVLADAGFGHTVLAVADSGRLGVYKPDLNIYRQALSTLKSNVGQTVMIGDSLTKDIRPARELGMKAVWLRTDPSLAAVGTSECADFVISSLDELPELLCRIH